MGIKQHTRRVHRKLEHFFSSVPDNARAALTAVSFLLLCIALLSSTGMFVKNRSTKVNASPAVTPRTDFWVTDGEVYDTAQGDDGTIYLAGDFTRVGPVTGNAVPVSATTGDLASTFPEVNSGDAGPIISDGAAGWFIGGSFSQIGGLARGGLAHILPDGTVDATWTTGLTNPDNFNLINSLVLDGTTLYVGGNFSVIGGQNRTDLAALDTTDGSVLPWNPVVTSNFGYVTTMLVNAGTLYIGGIFTAVDGQGRSSIASFDTTTGVLNAFSVDVQYRGGGGPGYVMALHVSGGELFIGGDFERIGAVIRPTLVSVNPTTGALNAMNLNISAYTKVRALASYGTKLYVGGDFGSIGGVSRNYFAIVDLTTKSVNSFDANLGSFTAFSVNDLDVEGTTLYVSGDFETISGQARNYAAAYDTTTDTITSWAPDFGDVVTNFDIEGGVFYASGSFNFHGGVERAGLAAINPNTGAATAWNPGLTVIQSSSWPVVNTIEISSTTAFFGGDFDAIGGITRTNIGAASLTTGIATSWNPEITGELGNINTLALSGSTLYVGGNFGFIDGQTRFNLGAFDTTTGIATPWAPAVSDWGEINTITIDSGLAYVGGLFGSVGPDVRMNAAAINVSTGLANGWVPDPSGEVFIIKVVGSTAYIGGCFDTIHSDSRSSLAATNIATGIPTSWDPGLGYCDSGEGSDVGVVDILINGNSVFIAGDFDQIGAATRNGIAEIDATTALATSWDLGEVYGVSRILLDDELLYLSGDFNQIAGAQLANFAVFDNPDGVYVEPTPSLSPSPSPEPLPVVQFSSTSSSGLESVTEVTIPVTISGIHNQDVTVDYTVTGGTASGGGVDYTLTSGSATIVTGQTSTTITLTIVDDALVEPGETVTITLSNPSNATLGGSTVCTYTITNNDSHGFSIVESGGSTYVTEGGASDSFTVALTSVPGSNVTVTLTNTSQVVSNPSLVTFTAGNWNTPQTIAVTSVDDNLVEGNHQSNLVFTTASIDSAYNNFAVTPVTVNIVDNDAAGISVVETGGTTTVSEAGLTDTVSMVLTSQPTNNVTVAVNSVGKLTTATVPRFSANVTNLTFTDANWNTPQFITITAVDDLVFQGTQTSSLTFTVTSGDASYNSLAVIPLMVTVVDNEVAPTPTVIPTLSPSPKPSASPVPTTIVQPVVSLTPTISEITSISVTPTEEPTPTIDVTTTPVASSTPTATPTNTSPATVKPSTPPPPMDLRVKVLDSNTTPIPGAIVRVPSINQEKKTGRDGLAVFKNVNEGNYDVFVSFKEEQREQKITVAASVPGALSKTVNPAISLNSKNQPVFNITVKLDSRFEQTVLEKLLADSGPLGIASVGVITVISLFQLIPILRPFIAGGFLLPLLGAAFGGKKRKQHSGQILDDLERVGASFARLKIQDAITKRVIKKIVCTVSGHFVIKLPAGQYILEITKSRYVTKQIIMTLVQEENYLESVFEISKDATLDIATQIPLKIAGLDPKTISSIFAVIISLINAIYLRTVIAIVICILVSVVAVALVKFSGNIKQLNFEKKD
jgi:trimeric autotransporter adhesin